MVRIVGILCGSAVAISLLIIVVGVPQFLPAVNVIETVEVAAITDEQVVLEPMDEPMPEPMPEPMVEHAVEAIVEPVVETPPRPQRSTEDRSVEHWFAFWSPFRSEIAANGFVAQLQQTTGMDYRVVRLKPGVYEVAFAYQNKGDIAPKLATISAATGLEMPDG